MNAIRTNILLLLGKQRHKPSELAKKIGISRQALHAHLRALVETRQIVRHGTPPHVQYSVTSKSEDPTRVFKDYTFCRKQLLSSYLDEFSKPLEQYVGYNRKQSHILPDLAFLLDAAAVYSSNIEGNTLDLSSFLNSRMSPRKHRPKEAQEIEDLVSAYVFARKNDLDEKNMLQAHAMFSKQFVSPTRRGVYRKEPVGVFSQHGLQYMAVEPHRVADEMHALFLIVADLLRKKQTTAEQFFWGSWLHVMIALIHPFSDGNGRTARLCEKWFLALARGKESFALPTEEQYWKNRSEYYASLKLGVNYWEVDMSKALPFFALLPRSLVQEAKRQQQMSKKNLLSGQVRGRGKKDGKRKGG